MFEDFTFGRRRFLGVAALSLAAVEFGLFDFEPAHSTPLHSVDLPECSVITASSFGALKQITAGVLNVGYAEAGPANGPGGRPAARLALRHPQLR